MTEPSASGYVGWIEIMGQWANVCEHADKWRCLNRLEDIIESNRWRTARFRVLPAGVLPVGATPEDAKR